MNHSWQTIGDFFRRTSGMGYFVFNFHFFFQISSMFPPIPWTRSFPSWSTTTGPTRVPPSEVVRKKCHVDQEKLLWILEKVFTLSPESFLPRSSRKCFFSWKNFSKKKFKKKVWTLLQRKCFFLAYFLPSSKDFLYRRAIVDLFSTFCLIKLSLPFHTFDPDPFWWFSAVILG